MAINTSKLRVVRTISGYSQDEVAGKLGVDQSVISLLETGKRELTDEFAGRLADLYGVTVDELLEERTADSRPYDEEGEQQ